MIKDFITGEDIFNFRTDNSSTKDEADFYIFDQYWDFSISNGNYKLDSESEQFQDLLLKVKKNWSILRYQSFYLNLCFRGLAYYYIKTGVNFKISKSVIHIQENESMKTAKNIACIEDMSKLMIILAQYKLEEYNKDTLQEKKEGVLIIFERIDFGDMSNKRIPALLPMYVMKIKKDKS